MRLDAADAFGSGAIAARGPNYSNLRCLYLECNDDIYAIPFSYKHKLNDIEPEIGLMLP